MIDRNDQEFDVVLWGATGFTGQLVAEYIAGRYTPSDLNWALAGRNLKGLRRIRSELVEVNDCWTDLPLLRADAGRPETLVSMADRTRVVCTAVGPYAEYGTGLVEACVETGTDYCDLCGEVPWMRQMIDRFHEPARQQGTRIVQACGFDALPSDVGVLMLQKHARAQFGSCCQRIKTFVESSSGGVSGGTAASLIQVMEASINDPDVKRLRSDPWALVPGRETPYWVVNRQHWSPSYDHDLGQWTVPFFMGQINRKVVHRSRTLLKGRRCRPISYGEYVPCGSGATGCLSAAGVSAAMSFLEGVMHAAAVRDMVGAYLLPQPGEGPDRAVINQGSFDMTILGTGTDRARNRSFHVEVNVSSDRDPGYGSSARMLAETAICLAEERVEEGQEGGVLTPASATGLSIVDRLRSAGMSWEVQSGSGRRGSASDR